MQEIPTHSYVELLNMQLYLATQRLSTTLKMTSTITNATLWSPHLSQTINHWSTPQCIIRSCGGLGKFTCTCRTNTKMAMLSSNDDWQHLPAMVGSDNFLSLSAILISLCHLFLKTINIRLYNHVVRLRRHARNGTSDENLNSKLGSCVIFLQAFNPPSTQSINPSRFVKKQSQPNRR